jgi:hypothetical protein
MDRFIVVMDMDVSPSGGEFDVIEVFPAGIMIASYPGNQRRLQHSRSFNESRMKDFDPVIGQEQPRRLVL